MNRTNKRETTLSYLNEIKQQLLYGLDRQPNDIIPILQVDKVDEVIYLIESQF